MIYFEANGAGGTPTNGDLKKVRDGRGWPYSLIMVAGPTLPAAGDHGQNPSTQARQARDHFKGRVAGRYYP